MKELKRLQELYHYKLLDTSPEQELEELTTLASAILDTPISLISLVDDKRQWFKAVKGLGVTQTPREDAFCQHALHTPQEVLVVDDPENDERFKENPLVTGDPHIRFYAGAPLETPNGHVLGTLCIIDNKPRKISEGQKKALQLIAKKVMDYLNTRKLMLDQNKAISFGIDRLRKLSDEAPGAIFQLEMTPQGQIYFPFISKGFAAIHPTLDTEELSYNADNVFSVVHPDDLIAVKHSLQQSAKNLTRFSVEYRVKSEDGREVWHWANAKPEKKEDGTIVWFGTFQDITTTKEYVNTLEQIVFDISHVMRKPVANMVGLTNAIMKYNMDESKLKEYVGHLKAVADEMDGYLQELNTSYSQLRYRGFQKRSH